MVPAAGGTGVSVSPTGANGVFTPAAMGQEQCGSQSQRLADAGLCVIEGLCAGIQGQVAGRASVSTFPKPSRGGHLCLPTKYKMEFKSGYSENTGQQSVLSCLLYVYLWCRPFLPSTAPSLQTVFCLKPDTGSEESGVLRNVTVAAQLQLLRQPKICHR